MKLIPRLSGKTAWRLVAVLQQDVVVAGQMSGSVSTTRLGIISVVLGKMYFPLRGNRLPAQGALPILLAPLLLLPE